MANCLRLNIERESTFNELHVSPQNITTNLPSNVIHIQEDSCVQFLIKGTTKQLPPSSLAVTAYAANTGTAVKVTECYKL